VSHAGGKIIFIYNYFAGITFFVPYRNNFHQELICPHKVELSVTAEQVIFSVQAIIGLHHLPVAKRPPLVIHFTKDPVKRCFALSNEAEWTILKEEWMQQVARKGATAGLEVVLPKQVRNHLLLYDKC
jgi:hypothetical protein